MKFKCISNLLLKVLILFVGIAAISNTSEISAISSYYSNAKAVVLLEKSYDEFYDVNGDGVVNVFDAIRINRSEYGENNRIINKYIYVGPDEKYTQIQDAIDNINDSKPHTIIVLASDTPYERFSMTRKKGDAYSWNNISPKNISIIGIDRSHCIVRSDSGDYMAPPAELLTNGIIKNITFMMTNDEQTPSATQGGYAAHIDARTLNDVGYNMQIEDCDFISASGPAVGIGLHQNVNLTFRRCRFTTTLSASYNPHSGYKNLSEYGCFFCHTSQVSDAQNQRIWIEDCVGICSEGSKSIWLAPAGNYTPATADFEYTLLRNIFWNKSTNSSAYNLVSSLKANPMNFGNNY